MARLTIAKRRMLGRALRPSARLENRYVRALRSLVRHGHEEMMHALKPDLAEFARKDRHDAESWMHSQLDVVSMKLVAEARDKVGPMFDRQARDVVMANGRAMRIVGIPVTSLRLGPELSKRREANIQLVEKAQRVYASQVRSIFEDPGATSLRVEELARLLQERGDVSESRAELIARDQTLKLNGAITQIRQENAGISSYIWSTSLDERVREEHAELEGQTFDWNAPPAVGAPGEDFQCRCIAIPVIEGLGDASPSEED